MQATQARIAKGDYAYNDDDLIFLPGGNAVIVHAAPKLVPDMISTKKPAKLMRNDGSVVDADRDERDGCREDEDLAGGRALVRRHRGAQAFDVHELGRDPLAAIRCTDIDYCSTINSTTCAVGSIEAPSLFMAMGGYKFIRDHEIMYERSVSRDKDFVVIEGALHGYDAVQALRDDARPVRQFDQEHVRLHPRLDERPVQIAQNTGYVVG